MQEINETKINRTYKDSLFRFIFKGDNEKSRRWLLSLYNALRGSNYEDSSQLEITTLEDVIYISVKNDLSFLINDEMYLFEHQSTVNPNMLKIENPLKKIVRQYNFLGLSRKQLGARLASDGHKQKISTVLA